MAAKKLPASSLPDLFGHNMPPARRLRVPTTVAPQDRQAWASERVDGIATRHLITKKIDEYRAYVDPAGNGPSSTKWDHKNFTAKTYKHLGLNAEQKAARRSRVNFRDTTSLPNLVVINAAEQIGAAVLDQGISERRLRADIVSDYDRNLAEAAPHLRALHAQMKRLRK